MIEINKNTKSTVWTITTTDSEGYHRQLPVSEEDMEELMRKWKSIHP